MNNQSRQQSNSPSGRSLIQLQPMMEQPLPVFDYMRLTMADNNKNYGSSEFSSTDYNAISTRRNDAVYLNDYRTHRPQRVQNITQRNSNKHFSYRPPQQQNIDGDLVNMEVEQLLRKNQEMNQMYKSGISLYSLEQPKQGYTQMSPQQVQQQHHQMPDKYRFKPHAYPMRDSMEQNQMNFSMKTKQKIDELNKQQELLARSSMNIRKDQTFQNVTYKNLEVRDDLMSTIGGGPSPDGGPRFSQNLIHKERTRTPSPEVLGNSRYVHLMSSPSYEPYTPQVDPFKQQYPKPMVAAPNENILKIDNFIKNLLQVSEDPQMNQMLFGSVHPKEAFNNFISDYDKQLNQELRQMRGLSPQQNQERIQLQRAQSQMNSSMQTVKDQDKKLPDYLRASIKQRDMLEAKFMKLNQSDILAPVPANMSDTQILSNGFDMKDLIPKNIDLGEKKMGPIGKLSSGDKRESVSPNRFQSVQATFTNQNEMGLKTLKVSKEGFLSRNLNQEQAYRSQEQNRNIGISNEQAHQVFSEGGKPEDVMKIVEEDTNRKETIPEEEQTILHQDTKVPESDAVKEIDQALKNVNVELHDSEIMTPTVEEEKKPEEAKAEGESPVVPGIAAPAEIHTSKPEEEKPPTSPKAIREYQLFENFEDPNFFNDQQNFDRIIDDLNKQDKYLDKSIISKKSMLQVSEQVKKDKKMLESSLKIDEESILKQNLNNQTLVEQELLKCIEQKRQLHQSQIEVEQELTAAFDGNQTQIVRDVSREKQSSAFYDSRQQRQSIELSFELQKKRLLEQEIKMKEQMMQAREKAKDEELKQKLNEQEEKLKKELGEKKQESKQESQQLRSSYKPVPNSEMSDELRVKTVFTEKLLKILYTF